MLKHSGISDDYILFDLSYIIHLLCFRCLSQYNSYFAVPQDQKELYKIDFSINRDFMAIYVKEFQRAISSLIGLCGVSDSNAVFCEDCSKASIWRMDHFSDYKINRMIAVEEGMNRGPIFKASKEHLLPKIMTHKPWKRVAAPNAEGDDVIAVLCRYILAESEGATVNIIGTDRDLLQLKTDRVQLMDINGNDVSQKGSGNPKTDLMLKVLMGDGGDGVPPVFEKVKGHKVLGRGFGLKTAQKVLESPSILKSLFLEIDGSMDRFRRNKLLVDFNSIPSIVRENIIQRFNESYGKF